MNDLIVGLFALSSVLVTPTPSQAQIMPVAVVEQTPVLAHEELDLITRLPNPFGAQVFADNILLSLHHLKGDEANFKLEAEKSYQVANMDWEGIEEPFSVEFTLQPGEVFAFHGNILPEFAGQVVKTMDSDFSADEGYKALAGLYGNGVCHLASLVNWVASEAGLEVTAKVNHDFYPVPGVARVYGTSIFYAPIGHNSQNQNLYIKNTLDQPVTFVFNANNGKVDLVIKKW